MKKLLITLFLGWAGVHKFLDKKTGIGILYVFTFGLFGVGWVIDIIIAIKQINKTSYKQIYRIEVAGVMYKKNEISSVLSGNKLYTISDEKFMQQVVTGKYIYKFKYREAEAILVPEPRNPHDSNAIKVLIDNVHVGYIPGYQSAEIKKKLAKVKSVKAKIHGGDYRYCSSNDVFKTEADFSIELYITM